MLKKLWLIKWHSYIQDIHYKAHAAKKCEQCIVTSEFSKTLRWSFYVFAFVFRLMAKINLFGKVCPTNNVWLQVGSCPVIQEKDSMIPILSSVKALDTLKFPSNFFLSSQSLKTINLDEINSSKKVIFYPDIIFLLLFIIVQIRMYRSSKIGRYF